MLGKTFRQTLRFTGYGESLQKASGNLHNNFALVNAQNLAILPLEINMHFHEYAPIFTTSRWHCKIEYTSFHLRRNLSITYFVSK